MHECRCPQRSEVLDLLEVEVTGNCELPIMGTVKYLGPFGRAVSALNPQDILSANMIFNLDCQLEEIWSHLGDTHLDMPLFLERINW